MSSSPTFIVSQTKEVEEEQMLARDRGKSHTSSPKSRPKSRLEILIMEMARSQEQKLESLVRAQSEQTRSQLESCAKSTEQKIDELTRGYTDGLAYTVGRTSSVEVSLQGTPSPSPNPSRRVSSPSQKQCTSPCLPL